MSGCMSISGHTMSGCMMKIDMMKPMHEARETMKDAKIELKAAKEQLQSLTTK